MKTPTITKETWRINNYRPRNGRIVEAKDHSTDNDSRPGSRLVCDCSGRNGNKQRNAKAIAAVPEMIKALINLENDDSSIPEPIWKMRNEALEKADLL